MRRPHLDALWPALLSVLVSVAVAACGPSTTEGSAGASLSAPSSAGASPGGSGAPGSAPAVDPRVGSGAPGPSGGILRSPQPNDPAFTPLACAELITGEELSERLFALLEDYAPDLEDLTNLTDADLRRADFSCTDLSGIVLRGANLESANFDGAVLTGVDFSGANLRDAELRGTDLSGVRFSATVCPDGTNSDLAGGTCSGHLNPEPPIQP